MYHTSKNSLKRIKRDRKDIVTAKADKKSQLHKAFLIYQDSDNCHILRKALTTMERDDLIGSAKHQSVQTSRPKDGNTYKSFKRKITRHENRIINHSIIINLDKVKF